MKRIAELRSEEGASTFFCNDQPDKQKICCLCGSDALKGGTLGINQVSILHPHDKPSPTC